MRFGKKKSIFFNDCSCFVSCILFLQSVLDGRHDGRGRNSPSSLGRSTSQFPAGYLMMTLPQVKKKFPSLVVDLSDPTCVLFIDLFDSVPVFSGL